MAFILSIETSTEVCSVAIHKEGVLIGGQRYDLAKSHSTLLASIINDTLKNAEVKVDDLSAVAVSAGPGSYTGLRIGVSTAKGISYAKNIPLIALDSLSVMYESFRPFHVAKQLAAPMMDARRMEVYCQLRDHTGSFIFDSKPLIIDQGVFHEYAEQPVVVFGNGAEKTLSMIGTNNVHFIGGIVPEARNMGEVAFKKFWSKDFEDVAYFEPYYLKEYRTIPPKPKL